MAAHYATPLSCIAMQKVSCRAKVEVQTYKRLRIPTRAKVYKQAHHSMLITKLSEATWRGIFPRRIDSFASADLLGIQTHWPSFHISPCNISGRDLYITSPTFLHAHYMALFATATLKASISFRIVAESCSPSLRCAGIAFSP